MRSRDDEKRDLDPGAYIGHEPELAAETIPGGVRPDDERVAAGETQSSGAGAEDERVQGRGDEWPAGHRHGAGADSERMSEKGGSGSP